MKSVLGTSKREIFDKKIMFTAGEALEECQSKEEAENELADGTKDDMYLWVTDAPDEILPLDPSLVRINTYFGVNKIGKMTNRPPPKGEQDPENRGTFLHVLS